jgi:hypothetical protein
MLIASMIMRSPSDTLINTTLKATMTVRLKASGHHRGHRSSS